MSTMITMLAPDGSSGEIPMDKVDAAKSSGFKVAVQMTSPDGKNGYIPADRMHEAAASGFKMVPINVPDAAKASYWDALTNPVGSGGREQGILGGITQVGGQAIKALANTAAHPIDSVVGAAKLAGKAFTGDAYGAGQDIVAPVMQKYQQDKAQGGNALALENLGGQAVGAVEGGRMLGAAGEKVAPAVSDATQGVAQKVQAWARPASSPSVVPRTEMAARNLSAAVLPATKDSSSFIKAAQQEVPNVLDYAKRTGNPLNTQLEFSKAAEGHAQEVRNLYEKEILGPVETKLVKTTGTGFGSRMQEGPDTYATLGDIDKRIVDLNKQLDAPALNSDDARRALASKTELKAEANGLKDILHQNLAESSGLKPEQIADVRQRVGRSYELANDTNAAVTARMQAEGKTDMGPIHMSQLPSRALEFARGGTVNIADRAFQRAIANFPGQASRLPEVSQPAPIPAPASLDRLEQLLSTARKQQQGARNAQFYPPISQP